MSLIFSFGTVQAQVTYTYDNLGRVISVADSTSGTAIYNYDAVGNIISIQQYAAGAPAPKSYSPTTGTTGIVVTVTGYGFSATPAQNLVKVNGVAATVLTASPNQLTFRVPDGTTTGAITIQIGSNTSTVGTFTVVPTPAIALSNMAIKAGESLKITTSETPFPVYDASIRVLFNGQNPTAPSSVTANQLDVPVPADFTEGTVTVESAQTIFKSSTTLYPMPTQSSASSSSVSMVKQFTPNTAPLRVNSTLTDTTAILRVQLTPGALTLPIAPTTAGSTGSLNAELFDPAGNKIKSLGIDLANPDSMRLTSGDIQSAGTYTLIVGGTQTPAFDVNVSGVSDASVALKPQTAANFGPNKAGQYIQLPMAAPETGPVQLSFAGVNLTNQTAVQTLSGETVQLAAGASQVVDSIGTTQPVQWTLIPQANAISSGTLTVIGTSVNTTAVSTSPATFTAAFPTQWYRRRFSTTSGQAIGIAVSDVNQPGGGGYGNITAETPNGLFSAIYDSSFLQTLIIPDPGTGMTAVTATPMSGATSNSLNLQVGPSLPLTPGAPAVTMTGATNAHTFAHFNVGAADKYQVVLNGVTVGTGTGKIFIQRPDNYYTYMNVSNGSDLILRADGAVATGLYALTVDPPAGGAVSAKVKLMTTQPTITDDQMASFSTTVVDDTVIHNFTGAAAAPRYLLVQGLTYTGGTGNGKLGLYPPSGNSTTISLPSNYNYMLGSLNQDGPYTVMVIPPAGGKVSGNIIESPGQNLPKASVVPVNLAAGQGKVFTFTGDAATSPNVTLSGITPTPTTTQPVKVVIYRPDGTAVATSTLTTASGTLNVPAITSTTAGTYVVGVFPPSGQATSFSISQDTAAPITSLTDNQLVSFSTTTTNEAFTRNFTGSTTSRYLLIQGLAYSGATGNGTATLLAPNNSTLSVALPTSSSWMFGNLTQNGSYNIKIAPPSGGKVSGKVLESTGTVISKGVQATLSVAAGQGTMMTFTGAAGTTPKLTFASLSPVPTASTPVNVVVFRPDGNKVASATYTSSAYAAMTLPAITSATAGTYVIGVFPANGQALNFKVTLN